MTDASRLDSVVNAIARSATIASRQVTDVTLIAVSKTQPAEAILPLLVAGQCDYGENRVQETAAKWPLLREEWPDTVLHLVGALQSNKAEDAVRLFNVIHAVDRGSLIFALARAQDKIGRRPSCFVQVNIGDEPQKAGCAVCDVPAFLTLARHSELEIAGLMCIPPVGLESAPYFALLAKLARDNGLSGLSMGMSADYETAVSIGATHVRVGTALFGGRAT